jgi:ABC-type amino acid transport substrate-binding protein
LKCNIVFLPCKRSLVETQYGKVDGAIGAFTSIERSEYAYAIPFPIRYSHVKVFIRKSDANVYKSIKDIHGKAIGINRGFHFSKDINDTIKTDVFDMKVANNSEANIYIYI